MTSERPGAASALDEKRRRDELGRRIDRLHRRILDTGVLRGALPLRARRVSRRAAMPDAVARERRLREASSAYPAAVADADPLSHSTRVITLDSLRWWVPLARPDDPALVERALEHQDFPYRAITQTRELALGGAMLDIGANIGRMSVPRVILGDVSAAYCAEPDPLNYACLVRNVRDNGLAGLVLPDRLAIAAADGTVRLARARSAGGHRVVDAAARSKHEVIEVPCRTLDTWVEGMGIDLEDVVFVKLDVQGSEVDVLRGAGRVLSYRHIVWQIEVDLTLLQARGFRGGDLFDLVARHFTHFVDLASHVRGDRVRRIGEMAEALSYVTGGSGGRTDVLVFTLEEPSRPEERAARA